MFQTHLVFSRLCLAPNQVLPLKCWLLSLENGAEGVKQLGNVCVHLSWGCIACEGPHFFLSLSLLFLSPFCPLFLHLSFLSHTCTCICIYMWFWGIMLRNFSLFSGIIPDRVQGRYLIGSARKWAYVGYIQSKRLKTHILSLSLVRYVKIHILYK